MILFYLSCLAIGLVVFALNRVLNDKLKQYPGPKLARWTNGWRFWDAITTPHQKSSLIRLHEQFGDVVRISPNVLSFGHPQAVRDIYGTDKHFNKSNYYFVAAAVARGRPTPSLFSSIDPAWHDNLRRAVQPAFNLSSLVQYEPFVDNTVSTYVDQLRKRYVNKQGDGGVVALERWMHWYAFDVIGELTYGARVGFLESASDIEGIIEKTHRILIYGQIVGQADWLDSLLLKNPVLLWLNRNGYYNSKPNPAVAWALKHQIARVKAIESGNIASEADGRVTLLDKFLQAKDKHPETVTDKEVLGMGLSMVFAGSETTAITLTAIFYFVLKNREVYRKLQKELDDALPRNATGEPVPLRVAQRLPYLDACVKEAFRCHPAARFAGERVIPSSGAVIAGYEVPPGTVVAVNAWVLHRRKDIFGDDVETYRPERWIPRPDHDQEMESARLKEMNRNLLQFGAGKYNCIGQNISILEMYKLVPSLLMAFDFELADPEREWRFEHGSFVNVSGVNVRIRPKED